MHTGLGEFWAQFQGQTVKLEGIPCKIEVREIKDISGGWHCSASAEPTAAGKKLPQYIAEKRKLHDDWSFGLEGNAGEEALAQLGKKMKKNPATKKSLYGGWPMLPSKKYPGELALTCPKCKSTDIVLTSGYPSMGTGSRGQGRLGDSGSISYAICTKCRNVGYLQAKKNPGGKHVPKSKFVVGEWVLILDYTGTPVGEAKIAGVHYKDSAWTYKLLMNGKPGAKLSQSFSAKDLRKHPGRSKLANPSSGAKQRARGTRDFFNQPYKSQDKQASKLEMAKIERLRAEAFGKAGMHRAAVGAQEQHALWIKSVKETRRKLGNQLPNPASEKLSGYTEFERDTIGAVGELLDGQGTVLGRAKIVAKWKTPHSFVSSHYFQIEVTTPNGKVYTGRGAGSAMVWFGKIKKG